MKLAKRITAITIAMALVMALCALPALADTDTKTLQSSDSFYSTNKAVITKATTIRTLASGRNGFVVFDTAGLTVTDGTAADYVQNAPVVTLKMKQSQYSGDFEAEVFGITAEKDSYSSTSTTFTVALYNAGSSLGYFKGSGKVEVSLDVTDYVKAQTDGKLVFKVKGDVRTGYSSNDIRYNNFSLTFDYSDEAKLNSAANKIEVNENYKEDFTLPLTGSFDSEISWVSDNEDVISIDSATGEAAVTRPQGEDASVKLTATVTIGETSVTKEFTVTVPAEFTGDVLKAVSEADLYVRKTNGDTYYGSQNYLRLNGSGTHNFVRFSQTDMPQNEILNAKLYLHYKGTTSPKAGNLTFTAYGMPSGKKDIWDEGTLTYNIAVSKDLISEENYMGVVQIDDVSTAHWVSVDVTDYVKAQADGKYEFRFVGDAWDVQIDSREVEGFEPYIELSRGDTGAVRSDAESIAIPEKLYGSYSALPIVGANGSTISWASDNAVITISGETMTAAAVSENTGAVLTATVTKNGAVTTRTFSVTALKSIFTFKADGAETETLPETGTVSAGIEDGTYIPSGATLFVALYGANGKLDYVRTFKNPAVIDLTADNASRISAYLWDSALTPIYTKTITK